MCVGWAMVFCFVLLGLVLDALHAFKLGYYLDVSNETRRLVWTLAHSHGTLIGLVHLAFAAGLGRLALGETGLRTVSWGLVGAGVIMPLGFFFGGFGIHGGDPGPAIFLVPVGGLALAAAAGVATVGALRARPGASRE